MWRKRLICIVAISTMVLVTKLPAVSTVTESAAPPSVLFELLALNHDLPTLKKPKYLSPTDLAPSPDGKLLYVAEQTAKRIDVVDVAAGIVVKSIGLPNEVTGIAVSPDGSVLYATCSSDLWPNGCICVVNTTAGKVTSRIAAGHGVRAPVLSPDGKKLFACNRFDNDVSVIDPVTGREITRIPAVREPYCAAITPDGTSLVVGNLLSDNRMSDSTITARVTLIDAVADTVLRHIRLTRGSTSLLGITVAPDGKYALVTHIISKYDLIGTTVERGWLHTNNLTVIDLAKGSMLNSVCLDMDTLGMGNPWGVRCSADSAFIVVAHAGTDELSIIDYRMMMDSVAVNSSMAVDMQKNFEALLPSRNRVPAGTVSPRALAIIGRKVYTTGFFADSAPVVNVFDLALSTTAASVRIPLDQPQLRTGERQGEVTFCNAKLCFQHWQSCHSCHPFHRADGLNWILGGGAVVAPKNTTDMVYMWWTPPYKWTGAHGHTQQGIVAAVELELFTPATRELVAPLDTFFMYMQPVPSPHLVKGRLSAAAARGKTIWYDTTQVNCFKCHPAPLFTDNRYWNTGVPDPYDANMQWVTPHLREAWRTAPYSHLGGMTLREMIELPTMSKASVNLTPQEIDDLMEYVLSL